MRGSREVRGGEVALVKVIAGAVIVPLVTALKSVIHQAQASVSRSDLQIPADMDLQQTAQPVRTNRQVSTGQRPLTNPQVLVKPNQRVKVIQPRFLQVKTNNFRTGL